MFPTKGFSRQHRLISILLKLIFLCLNYFNNFGILTNVHKAERKKNPTSLDHANIKQTP